MWNPCIPIKYNFGQKYSYFVKILEIDFLFDVGFVTNCNIPLNQYLISTDFEFEQKQNKSSNKIGIAYFCNIPASHSTTIGARLRVNQFDDTGHDKNGCVLFDKNVNCAKNDVFEICLDFRNKKILFFLKQAKKNKFEKFCEIALRYAGKENVVYYPCIGFYYSGEIEVFE